MLKVQDKPFTNIEDITKINMVTQNVVVCTSLITLCACAQGVEYSLCLSICGFVSLFGYTEMSTLSEVGNHAMCTYHVRVRNEKIVASTYLTSESVLRRAKKQGLFLLI